MAYAATAGGSLPSTTAAPGVLALQRAMVWLAGASIAIVFIEPSPYELATLAASVIFFATGLRMRLVFMPLLLLLFLINLGYSISRSNTATALPDSRRRRCSEIQGSCRWRYSTPIARNRERRLF